MEIADSVGETRLANLLQFFLGPIVADQGRLDEALHHAVRGLEKIGELGMLYMRSEANRTLGYVHFRRKEYSEALIHMDQVLEITEGMESRISRLWMGPVHVETLLALGRVEDAKGILEKYAALVDTCQSPHFSREVERLKVLMAKE